ncbi:phytolongin Phyl1.1-like [Curcuma longa]|uniref:phytolongin Phyl1.1-like n=1 Tax=Curcuma longa TaxID=136217 RepID=UPI003D9F49C7
MSPPVISTVYCCVAKGTKVIYFYNSADQELEALAFECLEKAPDFHHWYFHTIGVRTFGFLMADGYTYFAIIDRSVGSLAVLALLENIREAFRKCPRRDLHDELVSVIKHLVSSLEYAPHSSFPIHNNFEGSNASPSTNQPLLKDNKHQNDGRTMSERTAKEDDMLMIDMPMQQAGVVPSQANSSSSRPMIGYKLWRRHVKLIVSADIILCLVLFSIWLAVCNGFHCVSK